MLSAAYQRPNVLDKIIKERWFKQQSVDAAHPVSVILRSEWAYADLHLTLATLLRRLGRRPFDRFYSTHSASRNALPHAEMRMIYNKGYRRRVI